MHSMIGILAIVVAGPMLGSELAVAVFLHPLLDRLPDDSFRAGRSAGARQLGRVMPYWYAATLVLLVVAAVVVPGGPATWLVSFAVALMAVVFVVTIAMMVPVNNRIAAYPADQPADELRRQARRWDRLHWVRVGLLGALFALLVVGFMW